MNVSMKTQQRLILFDRLKHSRAADWSAGSATLDWSEFFVQFWSIIQTSGIRRCVKFEYARLHVLDLGCHISYLLHKFLFASLPRSHPGSRICPPAVYHFISADFYHFTFGSLN